MVYLLLILGLLTTLLQAADFDAAATTAPQLTVAQAHAALTTQKVKTFMQKNPEHPGVLRIPKIIKALEEYIDFNPNGQLAQEHGDEIQTILTLANTRALTDTSEASILGDSIPFLIKAGAIVFVFLFLKRQFVDTADISGQLSSVQQENKNLKAELKQINAALAKVDAANRQLGTLVQRADTTLVSIKQQVDCVMNRHDASIEQLVVNDQIRERNQGHFNQRLDEQHRTLVNHHDLLLTHPRIKSAPRGPQASLQTAPAAAHA